MAKIPSCPWRVPIRGDRLRMWVARLTLLMPQYAISNQRRPRSCGRLQCTNGVLLRLRPRRGRFQCQRTVLLLDDALLSAPRGTAPASLF